MHRLPRLEKNGGFLACDAHRSLRVEMLGHYRVGEYGFLTHVYLIAKDAVWCAQAISTD